MILHRATQTVKVKVTLYIVVKEPPSDTCLEMIENVKNIDL